MVKRAVTIRVDDDLWRAFKTKVLQEKGKLALGEKIEELIAEYLNVKKPEASNEEHVTLTPEEIVDYILKHGSRLNNTIRIEKDELYYAGATPVNVDKAIEILRDKGYVVWKFKDHIMLKEKEEAGSIIS